MVVSTHNQQISTGFQNQMSAAVQPSKEIFDPRRCQATVAGGPCKNQAIEGSTYCSMHVGTVQGAAHTRTAMNYLRIVQWKQQLDEKLSSPNIKTLREEIGVLRIIIEERLRQCVTTTDLILNSVPISELLTKVEKLVVSCHKLEGSMGQLLDKQELLQFANEVVLLISTEIQDTEVLDRLAKGIIGLLHRQSEGE